MSTHQQSAKLVANCIQINHNWHIKIQKKTNVAPLWKIVQLQHQIKVRPCRQMAEY